MRIVVIGDVVGRTGRDAVERHLPAIKERLRPDYIVLNGDNAAHGFGITGKICEEFYGMGVHCITAGNHVWDQREILAYISNDPKLLRPLNYPAGTQGNGARIDTLPDGRKILVVHALGRIFMEALEDPFSCVNELLKKHPLGRSVQAVLVDFHGEATSEKVAFAHYVDGKVSAVVGTHTHVPTADAQILENGTAYLTDLGMTGDYDSVIGMQKQTPIQRFVRKVPGERMTPAGGDGTLCGALVVTDDRSGLAKGIEPIRIGPRLQEHWPTI